ncbi:DUF4179 domain-containing protein [Alkalibaculum sporogenes]|uniref:DUF4179 domain-containing protein n=1 Tax=Alkalibaculum sporogenes TaxID=2655001 RepID=UPI00187BB9A9|nr:DUF4179 domain-containing protein [Alkalibaculum sporogenes]
MNDKIDDMESKEKTKTGKHGSRIHVSKRLIQSLVAAVLLTILIISTTMSPNTQTNVRVIDSVFRSFGDRGLKLASEKEASSLVGQTMIDKGIEVTINDVLYDGTRLSIGYTMEGKIGELEQLDLLVNDEPISGSVGYTGSFLSKRAYAGIITVISTNELPKDFKLTIILNKIGNKKGSWEFKDIPVKNQDHILNSKIITPMVTKPLRGGSITIEEILISDSSIELNVTESNTPEGYDYQVIDNYGNVLRPLSGSGYGEGEGDIMKNEFTFEPLHNNPQHFVIKVLAPEYENTSLIKDIKVKVTDKFPIIISQGEGGEISVNKIEYLKNKTLVHYTYKGNDPYGNGLCVWVEDNRMKILDNPTESTQRNKINYTTDGSYILECNRINKNKEITIGTKVLPDINSILEFEIPLK